MLTFNQEEGVQFPDSCQRLAHVGNLDTAALDPFAQDVHGGDRFDAHVLGKLQRLSIIRQERKPAMFR